MVEVPTVLSLHWITAMQTVDHDANEGYPNMFIRWDLRNVPQPSTFERDANGNVPGGL
jgi:hypothetical protein